jgi:uncharacterized membrane protein YhaH (DUF805 family)
MDNGIWYLRRGRIDRRTYWLHHVLPLTAASILAVVLDLALGLAWYRSGYVYDGYSVSWSATFSGGPITLITSAALLVPSLAASVARLHDRGRSAWWLLFWLLPVAGPIVLLVQFCLAGDPGPNAYGPRPGAGDPRATAPYQPVLR